MHRLLIVAIVGLIGFAPLTLRSVSARQWEGSESWQGVTVQERMPYNPEDPTEPFQLLADFLGVPPGEMAVSPASFSALLDDAYPVSFMNGATGDVHRAHIPEVQGAEFMVVIVASGEFVLDVKGPGSFLVDPATDPELQASADQKIRIMDVTIDGKEVHYTPTEPARFAKDENGADCENLCTVLPGVAVQLTDGDRVIAPAGAICIWCLLNQHEHVGETEGLLYAFPLLVSGETFSWDEYDDGSAAPVAEPSASVPSGDATQEQLVQAMPWAFFNPAGNCRSP
jgi:hypothetical protein